MAQRFQSLNMNGADLSHQDLSGAAFESCNLNGADFTGAVLRGARFESCNLNSATFPASALSDARFESCNMRGVRYVRAEPKAPPVAAPSPKTPEPPIRSQGSARPSWFKPAAGRPEAREREIQS